MKTLLITGASSGIGMAVAIAAAQSDWWVIACGRNEERLATLKKQSPNIETKAFDTTDIEACRAALAGVKVDALILNAGSCEYVNVDDFEVAMFRRVFDANFFGTLNCVDVLLPQLMSGDQILFVDSLARLLPFTRSGAYGASKAALHYFAKTLEVDLTNRGVVVKTVSPGFVRTPLTDLNEFRMPMRIEPEQAAKSILRALGKRSRSHYFPTLFAAMLRVMSMLPESLQIAICRRMARQQELAS